MLGRGGAPRSLWFALGRVLLLLLFVSSTSISAAAAPASESESESEEMAAACPSDVPRVAKFADAGALSDAVASFVVEASRDAVARHGTFVVAFSGGSLPAAVAPGLLKRKAEVQWDRWRVVFADERHVPWDHADSNLRLVREALLDHVPVAPEHVLGVNARVPVETAAAEYAAAFAAAGGRLDLVLLGMGPDGHTASLFPGHPLLALTGGDVVVAPISDSPKPPPARITFTLGALNRASAVAFVATGASKAVLVARCAVPRAALEPEPLPAARVRPVSGSLVWFLDEAAAGKL